MNPNARRWVAMAFAVSSLVALAGCGGAATSSPPAGVPSDTGPVTMEAAQRGAPPVTLRPSSPVAPTSPPATDSSPATAPATAASTAAPDPGPTDAATGLSQPARRTSPPAGTVIDAVADPVADQATLFIEAGSQSYSGTGGSCSQFDGYTYVFVGAPGSATATLSWNTAVPSEGQFLTWQYGASTDTALISTHGIGADHGIRITFGGAGTSGSFTGWYYLVESETFWEFEGSFSCLPAPLSINGEHPVSLIDARCTADGISAGGSGSADAALLSIDLDAPEIDGQREGALTWRVGGVVYATDWLLIMPTVDGLGGSFIGRAIGPDGFSFDVDGSFNCLTG